MILSILWDPAQVIELGPLSLRFYSLFWILGLAAAYYVVYKLYQRQEVAKEKFDPLFFYCFLGILIGARLGHCLLYQPDYFLAHPLEMLLPVRWDAAGDWHFTGYAGLASHGGTLGLILALVLYCRSYKMPIKQVVDNIAIATPLTACCIRLGNLMNSEIVGKATGSDWGFIFAHLTDPTTGLPEAFPRHPGQLYEAIAYLVFFFVGLWFYKRWPKRVGTGFYFGWCLTSIFTFRLFVEMFKEVQEPWELQMQDAIMLNQGQLLSIPFIIVGAAALILSLKSKPQA